MFRKRRVATPHLGHAPWNPIHGAQANLRQDGTAPYCAMMQVAAEDTYDNYVICRGFDPRILRFVDYAAGDANKPGISVAKPYGKRTAGTYQLASVYPAMLPTQGNSGFADFRQVVYTPPSPSTVDWRVGQNPGKVTGGGVDGGQPAALADAIEILHDHNGKVVNWLLIDSGGADASIQYEIASTRVAADSGAEAPYNGLTIATVTVKVTTPNKTALIGTQVEVVDHTGCIFDLTSAELANVWGWASWRVAQSRASGAATGELTPAHWSADDRCC